MDRNQTALEQSLFGVAVQRLVLVAERVELAEGRLNGRAHRGFSLTRYAGCKKFAHHTIHSYTKIMRVRARPVSSKTSFQSLETGTCRVTLNTCERTVSTSVPAPTAPGQSFHVTQKTNRTLSPTQSHRSRTVCIVTIAITAIPHPFVFFRCSTVRFTACAICDPLHGSRATRPVESGPEPS